MADDGETARDATAGEGLSRREFVVMSAAAGLAAVSGKVSAADAVVEKDVQIATPDGKAEAAFFHTASGTHPGVLIWTDAFGLRPFFREMGRRLAAEGYAVLVPNPFYRLAKSPVFADVTKIDFGKDREKFMPLIKSVSAPGAAEMDAKAYVAFLLAQPQVNAGKKIGVQGYCMGGPLMMRTAATLPEQVGAGASFHGGGLATDKPESPHLLAPKIRASLYIGIAGSDDAQDPKAKDTLRAAFDAAKVKAQIEVYSGVKHGWCVADMPMADGKPIYDQAEAERAWGKLLALYRGALA
jgi:carboxymethylenebutenolidase